MKILLIRSLLVTNNGFKVISVRLAIRIVQNSESEDAQEILTEQLRMVYVATKFNPKFGVFGDNLNMVKSDEHFFNKIGNGDKSWVYG